MPRSRDPQTDTPSADRPSRRWRWLRAAGLITLVMLLAATAALALAVSRLWPALPPLDRVIRYEPQQPLQVYSADGVPIAQFGAERRQFVPIERIPPLLQGAVLAVEDTRFHAHHGLDPRGIVRAMLANLGGGLRQGASTITQQVARTFFLTQDRTLERKLKEALLALQIERQLDKAHILELYMNQIYLGQRAYGFEAAAQTYFGKSMDALTLAETALLAGLPQNPGYANPIVNPGRARARQAIVLARMETVGLITPAQRAQAVDEPLSIRSPAHAEVHAGHLAEMARQFVVARYGEEAYARGYRVYTSVRAAEQQAAHAALRRALLDHDRQQSWRGPEAHEPLPYLRGAELERAAAQALRDHQDDDDLRLAIVTDVGAQGVSAQLAAGETVLLQDEALVRVREALQPDAPEPLALRRGAVIRLERRQGGRWSVTQWPQVQGAFVALEPATGRVRALVGGFDYGRSAFNRATQAWRQAGSVIKPFLWSAALERGVMPDTLINDAPLAPQPPLPPASDASAPPPPPDYWQPRNADGRFDGPLTLREGLVRSKNLVAVRLLRHIGVDTGRDWLTRFGFEPARWPDNLTLALGTGTTTPMQLAQAYAVLAQGGYPVVPTFIERITDADGVTIYTPPRLPPHDEATRVIPARNAFVIGTMLQDVTRRGTAAPAQRALARTDLYGKTGTTNDVVDAWFAGFQPGVVAVAWVGHDEPRSLGSHESGAALALPVWIGFMAQALQGVDEQPLAAPPDVVRVDGDWRYAEWAAGGHVERIDVELTGPPAPPDATIAVP